MDGRRTVTGWIVYLSDSIISKMFHGDKNQRREFIFDNMQSFREFVKSCGEYFYCDQVELIACNTHFDISEVVKCLAGVTDRVHVSSDCQGGPSTVLIESMVNAFVNHPILKSVDIGYRIPDEWNEYCSTVYQWAHSQGIVMRGERACGCGFRKVINNGENIVVVYCLNFTN